MVPPRESRGHLCQCYRAFMYLILPSFLKQLISHAESMYQIFGVSAIVQINVLSGDSKIIKLNKLLLQSNLKLKMSTLIGQQTNMNTSIAHRAGSPGNDCPHDGGELHPGAPRPAWEIPGAAPGGGVGSK